MNVAITLENLNSISLPMELNYSSDSFVESIDKIEEQIIDDKFSILKENIGGKLFKKLSYEQKSFIVQISGTINLGKSVDINSVYNLIEKIEHE